MNPTFNKTDFKPLEWHITKSELIEMLRGYIKQFDKIRTEAQIRHFLNLFNYVYAGHQPTNEHVNQVATLLGLVR